nr:immunoglobulin heavy chain junction region [Macaca mulatta]
CARPGDHEGFDYW